MSSLLSLLEVESVHYEIFCDMDGVLTDFEGRFEYFTGISADAYTEVYGAPSMWRLIDNKIGKKYWTGMEWMKGGRDLWKYISKHKPTILTTPSRDPVSREGKRIWIEDHIEPMPRFIFSMKKQDYARPNRILIDDRDSNLEAWEQAGGISIKCKDGKVEQVILKLKSLGI